MDWLLTAAVSAATGAWITHAGLRSDVDRLCALLPRAHALIDRAEQWRFTNAGVADLLFQLKDATYDADDLVDELTGQERQASDKPFSSLCIFVRELVVGTAHKVRDIHARLDLVTAELERAIEALDMQHKPMLLHRSRETSSFLGGNLVLGRDREHEELVHLLLDSDYACRRDGDSKNAKRQKKCEGVAVLPIVGIGGVGKTTLAQVVYNDQTVQDHFHLRMWVCMPESLDVTRLTKEIIESATKGASEQSSLANLDTLQGIAKDLVVSRRFFLVLDDAWSVDVHEWQRLCAPLKNGLAGSVVLVTTRSQKVADAVGTMDPLCLRGLPDEAYWDLFKLYTFGEQDIAHHPELEVIGKKIISKLKGSPLAAKTVSGMLRSDMSTRHWRTIMNSELWELEEQGEGDILPALQLSYQYLPAHLKRCFAFCSIFPKGYTFQKQTLIDMWIAQGFIEPRDSIGNQCWKELLSRSFFQQHVFSDISCSMHDLMCDLSQAISIDECAQLDSKKWQQTISYTVRHVSVYAAYQEPSTFLDIGRFTKLRSLVIFDMFEQDLSYLLDNLFRRLTNLRLLVLRKCMIKELPKSISYLKHLRYLDVSSTKIRRLPDSALQLSKLQVLNIQNLSLDNHPKCMSRLTNLRKCYIDGPITSLLANLSNSTSLQNSILFDVPEGQGQRIAELKNMTQLIEVLHIRNLEKV